MNTDSISNRAKQRAAINQIRNKAPVPDTDFTIHVTEDGSEVSTTGRVVKEVQAPAAYKPTDEQFRGPDGKPDHAFLKVCKRL